MTPSQFVFFVPTKTSADDIQRKLYSLGYQWDDGEHTTPRSIYHNQYIHTWRDKTITCHTSMLAKDFDLMDNKQFISDQHIPNATPNTSMVLIILATLLIMAIAINMLEIVSAI